MGLLKHFRSSSKLKNSQEKHGNGKANGNTRYDDAHYPGAYTGRNCMSQCPPHVLKRIFEFVCPHSLDKSYEACEDTNLDEDGCALCDLRDLSHCAQTSRAWYQPATELLYSSVRIDAVHYCALEEILALKRRRKSKYEAEDVPQARLRLLAEVLRGNSYLSSNVHFIKVPYMTRETAKKELALCVSCSPNLQYVDLPDGFYSGDPNCHTLRQELLARCPEIRKMKYVEGAEQYFQFLAQRHWLGIEVLELQKLRIEPTTFRAVIACLPVLHEMKVVSMPSFTDAVFHESNTVANFPPLQKLTIERCHGVTAAGLTTYLDRPETREVFETLSLKATGVSIVELPSVLWAATHLKTLTMTATVEQSLPLEPLPPLSSISLQVLHYDITPTEEYINTGLIKPSDSYYNYLTSSLLSNSLPALRELYVRDPGLPDALLLAPPQPKFAGSRSQPRGFSQPLDIYTKGQEDTEWVFNPSSAPEPDYDAPGPTFGGTHGRSGSMGGRPVSTYHTQASSQWSGEARRSVVVGNGVGGFLAVPAEELPQPGTSSSGREWGVRPISYATPGTPHRPGSSHAIANAIKDEPQQRASFWGGKMGGGHRKTDSSASKHDLWR